MLALPSPTATPPPTRTERYSRSRASLQNRGTSFEAIERELQHRLADSQAECSELRGALARRSPPRRGFHPDAAAELDRLADEAALWRRRAQRLERELEYQPTRARQYRSRSPVRAPAGETETLRSLTTAQDRIITLTEQLACAKKDATAAENKCAALDTRNANTLRNFLDLQRGSDIARVKSEADIAMLKQQARFAEAVRHSEALRHASGARLAPPAFPCAVPAPVPRTASPVVTTRDLLDQLVAPVRGGGSGRPATPVPQPAAPPDWSPTPPGNWSPRRRTPPVLGPSLSPHE